MAIQNLNTQEVSQVAGGGVVSTVTGLVGSLPVVGGLLGGLLATLTGLLTGLPVVGGIIGTVLGVVSSI